ncbi:dentin matrix acidic phosphoprotein [Spatholobus suberectus]|nr:dentin matrix acidic phosphoprotein [Spatholobus suberectus]
MLHPGGTESEGASVMKVCSYTYCSLNDHGHAPLPPLKSFMSARRRLLETQKNIMPEAMSPQRWKVSCDTKNDSDIEHVVFDGKPACDEADTGNPTITPFAQEIGMDFFIDIYANKNEGSDEMGRFNSVKDLEDQEDISFANEENGIASEEDGVKQVTPGMTHDLPKVPD